jgi:sugar phosphate isomerase/epimerase
LLEADGLEVLFYSSWYPEAERIAGKLLASGLRFPVLHTEKSIGPSLGSAEPEEQEQGLKRLEANCQFASQLGARLAVLHLWGLPDSDEQLERNLEMLGACLALAIRAGLELAVEIIPCVRATPLSNVRRAIEQDARCLVALDTEFLAFHQQLDGVFTAEWLWKGRRIQHIHIKDYDGQMADPDNRRRYLHPGEGKIDFPHFFSELAKRGSNGSISLEASGVQRDGSINIYQIQASIALLRSLLERKGQFRA